MALSNITIPRKTFEFAGETFAVRGLSTDDIAALLLDEKADTEKALDIYDQSEDDDKGAMLIAVAQHAPRFVAKAIARAADEPEAWESVLRLPAPMQIDVLFAVWNMTLTEPDSLKKLLAQIAAWAQTIKSLKT